MKKLIVVSMFLIVVRAQAVIVAQGDGMQNTSAPTGGQGWDYVGRITSPSNDAPSSVTYIDNNWFITAYHINQLDSPVTGVSLDGSPYTINQSSWTRITNSTGSNADLIMFRVEESVGLDTMSVSAASPSVGQAVTMIGNGLDRHPDLLSLSLPGPDEYYYHLKSGTANTSKRWGSNTSEGDYGVLDQGYGATDAFYTDFDNVADEGQGATWDSGGGVFVDNGTGWELAGLMLGVGNLYSIGGTNAVMLTEGNPANAGSETYIADLSVYVDQINATTAIPEPSVLVLGSVIAIAGFSIRRIFMV